MPPRHKISVVLGTRPEAIKLAPVLLRLRDHPRITCHVCLTAQHRQMVDQVLRAFAITPDEDLNLMLPGQGLADLTARAIPALFDSFRASRPDLVLVQGDTTTVFCAALAAFYCRVPVGHVEAGLRTGDLDAPWPEEGNRVLTSRLARLHFAPTERARENLLREGIPPDHVHVTGNTVIDALLFALGALDPLPAEIGAELTGLAAIPAGARIVLITGHRRESFGEGLRSVCRAIHTLARRFPDAHFVYPVHLNPRVREPVEAILEPAHCANLHLVEPLSYLAFVHLMSRARLILTDSGGVQEEAPSLGVPVLVMRGATERPEAVEAGCSRLVGTDEGRIVEETARLLTDRAAHDAMSHRRNPYGDGKAAGRIVESCEAFLDARTRTP